MIRFYLKCLAGLTVAGGVSLLIAGLILVQSTLVYTGTALVAGAVGITLLNHGLFSNQFSSESSTQQQNYREGASACV